MKYIQNVYIYTGWIKYDIVPLKNYKNNNNTIKKF